MSKKGDLTVHENGHTTTNSVAMLGKRHCYLVLASHMSYGMEMSGERGR